MAIRLLFSILLLLNISSRSYSYEKGYLFEYISPESGFTFSALKTVITDDNGFVWFGCDNGLYYYNTKDFKRYILSATSNNKNLSITINKLYKDTKNDIWTCTSSGIFRLNRVEDRFDEIPMSGFKDSTSSKHVQSIIELNDSTLIMLINNHIYNFDRNKLTFSPININENHDKVTLIEKSGDGRLFVGFDDGAVFCSSDLCDFQLFYNQTVSSVKTICFDNDIYYIGYDTQGVDVVNSDGITLKTMRETLQAENNLPNNKVRKIVKRENGEIWIGTYNGLMILTRSGNKTVKATSHNGLPHNSIYDIHIDRNDALWIGTWSGGLAYYADYNYKFYRMKDIPTGLQRGVISAFAESKYGHMLIASENVGLNHFDIDNGMYYNNPVSSHVKSMARDNSGRLWIGTIGFGLYYLDNEEHRMIHMEIPYLTQNNVIISSITVDKDCLWLSTRAHGLVKYNRESKSYTHYRTDTQRESSLASDLVWSTTVDSKGNLFVCTDGGLSVKKSDSDLFKQCVSDDSSVMAPGYVYVACEWNENKIMLGTKAKGVCVYDTKTERFEPFKHNDKMQEADVYSIIKDKRDNIWFSTNNGIYIYYTREDRIKHFSTQDGLLGNQYHPVSGFVNSEGIVFFGSTKGFSYINPDDVCDNPIQPKAFLSKLFVNNMPMDDKNVISVDYKHLPNLTKVELEHNQNSLLFEFASNNFLKSHNNKLRYRLKNYNDQWTDINYSENIAFTKIPPGKYVLEVFCSNNDNLWSSQPCCIEITINPPVWLTWYAILIYVIMFIVCIMFIIKDIAFRVNAKKEIVFERYRNEVNETTFSDKLKFFMNVSHELRTPLSLIISPLNLLESKLSDNTEVIAHLKTVRRNADRLLRLTNQILDFRLLEVGKMKANMQETDIVELCHNVCACFSYQLANKNIDFKLNVESESIKVMVDPDMFEKIVYNILSNALKFSDDGSKISVAVSLKQLSVDSLPDYYCVGHSIDGKALEVSVSNTGQYIQTDQLPEIFERFHFNPDNAESGAGIGLHLCQEYAKLMSGHIMVASEDEGYTTFLVHIPVKDAITTNRDKSVENLMKNSEYIVLKSDSNKDEQQSTNKKVVLIVEDNDELRFYLKALFSQHYKVITAKNGAQGVEIATDIIPDIIVSDILMPRMDGVEFTGTIRKNQPTNHIPIILLTALTDRTNYVKGINAGANVYLPKPIDEGMLFAHVEALLSTSGNIKAKYEEQGLAQDGDSQTSFLSKIEQIIERNLQNQLFDTAMLADILCISRSSLHRKIKQHSNQSTSEFIRDYRLKIAVKLMKDGRYNMDEIAIYVGFNSSSYFSRSFKSKYGKTPKDFFNEHR